MKRQGGKKPGYEAGFAVMLIALALILTGPAVYLGCGPSSAPPPARTEKPREKVAPPAVEELAKENMARQQEQQMARMEKGSQQLTTRGGHAEALLADQDDIIKRFIDKMLPGNIAFNVPATMNLQETALIQLVLSLEKPIDELKQMIEAEGAKQGTSIKVANIMVAQLKGTHFHINAINPESQVVTPNDVTEWKWEVKPTSSGPQALHLTLSAQLTVDGQPTSKLVRTFDKTIEVNVTMGQRARDFVDKFGQWLWAGVIIPLAGWLWKRRKAAPAAKKPDEIE